MKRTKRFSMGLLSVLAIASLAVGTTMLSSFNAKAETVTVPMQSIISVTGDATTASGVSYASKYAKGTKLNNVKGGSVALPKKTYTGIDVTSTGAYTGAFNGTFTGNTTLNYNFSGTGDANYSSWDWGRWYASGSSGTNFAFGDTLGDFYFKITSVADSSHSFTYSIKNVNGKLLDLLEFEQDSNNHSTIGFNNAQQRGWNNATDSVLATNCTPYYAGVHNDESAATTRFSFEKNSSGYWAFKAYRMTSTSKWTIAENSTEVTYVTFNGTQISAGDDNNRPKPPVWDFSDGYTIEFGSNYETGTNVVFTALNGTALSATTIDAEKSEDAVSTVSHPLETVVDGKNVINLEQGAELGAFSVKTPLKATLGSTVVTPLVETTETVDIDTSVAGTKDVTVAGKAYTINVIGAQPQYVVKVLNLDGTERGTYAAGSVDLSASTVESNKEFIGWNIDGKVYPANYVYTVPENLTEDITITAVGVDFDMQVGASVRASSSAGNYGGLRFVTGYNTADVVSLKALGGTVTFGTIIAPKDSLNESAVTKELTSKLDLVADKFLTTDEVGKCLPTFDEENTYYTGTITNLVKANYSREFSARAYVTVAYADGSTATVYSDYTETRSALYVAEKAKEASEVGEVLDAYINGVAKLTANVVEGVLSFEGNAIITQEDGVYTITNSTVYSLIINGTRISMVEGATSNVKIDGIYYTVSAVACDQATGAVTSFVIAKVSA